MVKIVLLDWPVTDTFPSIFHGVLLGVGVSIESLEILHQSDASIFLGDDKDELLKGPLAS